MVAGGMLGGMVLMPLFGATEGLWLQWDLEFFEIETSMQCIAVRHYETDHTSSSTSRPVKNSHM